MRTSAGIALSLFLTGQSLLGYTYSSNYSSVDYSGMTANGGTIIVPMVLTSGDVGTSPFGASFNVAYTVTAITNLPGASDVYNWDPITQSSVSGWYGLGFPDSIYTSLPDLNTQRVPYTINGVSLNRNNHGQAGAWIQEGLNEGYFQMLGAFSISVAALPNTPDGFIKESELVRWGLSVNATVDNFNTYVFTGMYSQITSQSNIFGGTSDFEFLAFNWEEYPNPIAPRASLPT